MEYFTDAYANLAATRFTMWWSFLLTSSFYAAYLWQTCNWRFWTGEPFNRALFGWTVEAIFLTCHQAYWWAVEHLQVVGSCAARDPLSKAATHACARAEWLRSHAPYLTPIFYAGIIIGIVLILPPIIVSVTGMRMVLARLMTKAVVIGLWFTGLVLTGV